MLLYSVYSRVGVQKVQSILLAWTGNLNKTVCVCALVSVLFIGKFTIALNNKSKKCLPPKARVLALFVFNELFFYKQH